MSHQNDSGVLAALMVSQMETQLKQHQRGTKSFILVNRHGAQHISAMWPPFTLEREKVFLFRFLYHITL
jgi:hypothetical protein